MRYAIVYEKIGGRLGYIETSDYDWLLRMKTYFASQQRECLTQNL